ncbi:TrmB family transcriptional regulator [Archaeoglobales archaeon]|nr:MAG: TrmB family transcriptional regulator [Archaeoglobales archaeon]
MSKVVDVLKNFGLSEYEAKAILTLLSRGILTAKEIAEYSGIPRTSVYDVMNSLLAKGLVESFGKPMKFRAISSSEIVSTISRRINEDLDYLKRELPKVEAEKVDIIRVYRGDVVFEKIKELVDSSKSEIVVILSYIPEPISRIIELAKVKVIVISSNAYDVPGDERHVIKLSKKIVKDLREFCHGFMVFDNEKMMMIFVNETKLGILSESIGVLEFIQKLITPLLNALRSK